MQALNNRQTYWAKKIAATGKLALRYIGWILVVNNTIKIGNNPVYVNFSFKTVMPIFINHINTFIFERL